MANLDIYTPKRTQDQVVSKMISQISVEEKIFYISEKISNKKLITLLRLSNLLFILLLCQIFLDFFSFKWIIKEFDSIMIIFLFLGIFIIIGGTAESIFRSKRKDFYFILSESNVIKILFSKKGNPLLFKTPLGNIHYYTIQKRFLQKSCNLILYDLGFERINTRKFKRIKDHLMILKYLDSLVFHFGRFNDQWLLKSGTELPIILNISKKDYIKIINRIKHINISFGISTPILLLIGILLGLFISDVITKIGVLVSFGLFGTIIYGTLAGIYLKIWHELMRHSSIHDQLAINNKEIRYNEIIFPLSQGIMISGVYLSSRHTTQTPQRPKPSIYCIEIKDILNFNKKKYFGPIDDFQYWFNLIYVHMLKWKNENSHLFSKEELYKNAIKRD
ncbi:MAG: hypothetical protein ACFE9C_05185 [Candidatus Hodarchaeota archaeon]